MKKELQDILIEEYPRLFVRHLKKDSDHHYRIEVEDGWYNLIRSLCRTIQTHVNNQVRIGSKVVTSTDQYLEVSQEDLDERKFFIQPEVIQIKEKWGGLRVYLSGGDGFISGAITLAEDLSFEICEFCGAPGKNQVLNGWYKTTCKSCKEKEYESKSGVPK